MAEPTEAEKEAQRVALENADKSNRSIEGGGIYYRSVVVEKADFADDNTFQISFASEFAGEQIARKIHEKLGIAKEGQPYTEILSMDPEHADLTRFNGPGGAAFLDEHKDARHIGSVKKATISKDKVARAIISLDGASKLSKTRAKQIRSGSRPNVSDGYEHTKYIGTRSLPDGRIGHVFAWRGLEISSVAVPFDPTVGEGRAAKTEMAHCYTCGRGMSRAEMKDGDDGALYCSQDCMDAEDPGEGEENGRKLTVEREFRMKTKTADGRETISHSDVESKVRDSLNADPRFKKTTDNGDAYSSYALHGIHQVVDDDENESFVAHVSSPAWTQDAKTWEVPFTYDGNTAMLGDRTEVEPQMAYEAVERGLTCDGRLIRADTKKPYGSVKYADPGYQKDGKSRYPIDTKEHAKAAWSYLNMPHNEAKYSAEDLKKVKTTIKNACEHFGVKLDADKRSAPERQVDSKKLPNDNIIEKNNNLPTTNMSDTATVTPEQEKVIRAKLDPEIRAAARTDFEAAQKATGEKVEAGRKEIRALAEQFVKDSGMNWAGKPGEVVVVGAEVRGKAISVLEAIDKGGDIGELTRNFKTDCGELIRNSRAPKNQEQAAEMDLEVAARCSLKRCYHEAATEAGKGNRVGVFMLNNGAEHEAHVELRKRMNEFPGGMAAHETNGICLPRNMTAYDIGRRFSTRQLRRMTRDSLAGDFPSAGALIAPQYKFPTIELLRNKMALGRAGITILSGVIGNLVLPRQTSATTVQSLAEGAVLAEYDQTFDQINLRPHRIGSVQKYSRLALLQTTEDFEALVMNDHMQQNALYADSMVLTGSGAGDQPLGILNQIGIGTVTFGGVASTAYNKLVTMETQIRKGNIDEEPSFITSSVGRGSLRITPATLTGSTVVSGQSTALWVGEDVIGRDAVDSQQVPGDVILALVGRHVVMAQWGGWQVVLDTLTQADQDKIKLSVNTYIDCALRHPVAISRSTDSIASLT